MTKAEQALLVQQLVGAVEDWAVVVVDVTGKIVSWNKGASALFGYDASEAEGRHFSMLYDQSDIAAGQPSAELKAALAEGHSKTFGTRVDKAGREIDCEFSVHVLIGTTENASGFGYVFNPPRTGRALQTHQETILVVDDDEKVRRVTARQLEHMGYHVIDMAAGSEALALLKKGTPVDLLFTDVVMPDDIGGRDLAAEALNLRPSLKILFASGYFEGALTHRGELDRNVHFLAKPYRTAQLARKVMQVLSGDAP